MPTYHAWRPGRTPNISQFRKTLIPAFLLLIWTTKKTTMTLSRHLKIPMSTSGFTANSRSRIMSSGIAAAAQQVVVSHLFVRRKDFIRHLRRVDCILRRLQDSAYDHRHLASFLVTHQSVRGLHHLPGLSAPHRRRPQCKEPILSILLPLHRDLALRTPNRSHVLQTSLAAAT